MTLRPYERLMPDILSTPAWPRLYVCAAYHLFQEIIITQYSYYRSPPTVRHTNFPPLLSFSSFSPMPLTPLERERTHSLNPRPPRGKCHYKNQLVAPRVTASDDGDCILLVGGKERVGGRVEGFGWWFSIGPADMIYCLGLIRYTRAYHWIYSNLK